MHYGKKWNWRLYNGEKQADVKSQPAKPPGTMVMAGPGLPHGTMSGSISLQQLGSVLMSVAQLTLKAI